jgi:hypothetical protein
MAIKVRHTKAKDPKGGVVAFSDGNDDAQVFISPKRTDEDHRYSIRPRQSCPDARVDHRADRSGRP